MAAVSFAKVYPLQVDKNKLLNWESVQIDATSDFEYTLTFSAPKRVQIFYLTAKNNWETQKTALRTLKAIQFLNPHQLDDAVATITVLYRVMQKKFGRQDVKMYLCDVSYHFINHGYASIDSRQKARYLKYVVAHNLESLQKLYDHNVTAIRKGLKLPAKAQIDPVHIVEVIKSGALFSSTRVHHYKVDQFKMACSISKKPEVISEHSEEQNLLLLSQEMLHVVRITTTNLVFMDQFKYDAHHTRMRKAIKDCRLKIEAFQREVLRIPPMLDKEELEEYAKFNQEESEDTGCCIIC